MTGLNRFKFLLIFVVCSFKIQAQENASKKLGSWYIVASNTSISNKLTIGVQTQFRNYEIASQLQQFKARLESNYKITKDVSVGVGYGYFYNDPSYNARTPSNFSEHRFVLDGFLNNKLAKGDFKQRFRFEHRMFPTGQPLSWMRYMLTYQYPLTQKVSVDIYDELFINLQGNNAFAQNWIGGGATYKINNLINTRIGYQNIKIDGNYFDRVLVGIQLTPSLAKQ